jgi:acetate kinase
VKILVANLGSTSFKYRLFDLGGKEKLLARGGVERIGAAKSRSYSQAGDKKLEWEGPVPDHAAAVDSCLRLLTDPLLGVLQDANELTAIGFKAVHALNLTGVQKVDERTLAAMEAYNEAAPAHNPPYVTAMRLLAEKLPQLPLVAAFETGFHQTIPQAGQLYGVPLEWAQQHGIRRWGFHGASHRYIAERASQLLGNPEAKIISCHLGGSSSLCAINAGKSVATSMGMSPQTGVPHNNRVGDFDPFALPALMKATGKNLDELLGDLAERSGLLGLSGISNDLRDIEEAAQQGNTRAKLAFDVFVTEVRHYLGAYLLVLGGADAIIFTGGIGENSSTIRKEVCAGLEWFGIYLDEVRNVSARGEVPVHGMNSRVQVWIMATNEELVVARQVKEFLTRSGGG